jgi:thioredoxin-related protein
MISINKITISTYILTLGYSLGFLLMWGLFLMDADNPGTIGVIICLIYTFYAEIFFINAVVFDHKISRYLKFIFPVFYLISTLFTVKFNLLNILLHPIITASIILVAGSQLTTLKEKHSLQFFVHSYILLYSFALYPIWGQQNTVGEMTKTYDFAIGQKEIKNVDIRTIPFIKSDDTSYLIKPNDKYVLIETWNEKCPPCFAAIKDLSDNFDQHQDKMTHFYLYQAPNKNIVTDRNSVFHFEKIKNKNKILIDKDNQLYDQMGLEGYPYFLLFDQNGQLIYQYFGYHPSVKDELSENILKLIAE